MHILDQENDPRILRDLAKLMETEIVRLNQVIKKIEEESAKKSQQTLNLEESLQVLRHKYFKTGSEKSLDRSRERLNEDAEILLHAQNIIPPIKKKLVRNLAEETIVHEASEMDLKEASLEYGLNNTDGSEWEKVEGLFEKSIEIDIVERTYKKVIHKRQKYKLKTDFNKTEKRDVLIAAPGPLKLIPGSSYTIDFAVSTVVDKYLNHLPLERQCRMMDSVGLYNMKTQVLWNLAKVTSMHLEPVVEKIKQEILSSKLVHSDETPWPINNKKDSNGYMWIVSNNRGSYYRFEPTRSGKVVQETLGSYSGAIMTDGYSGYNQYREDHKKNINKNLLALCHAHARRNFKDIEKIYSEVAEVLRLYRELFYIEKLATNFTDLQELRQSRSRLIIDQMYKWLTNQLVESRPESELRKAVQYSLNHWKELTVFLDQPEVPLTNNEAERTIRQAVMGRKNFYGSRSIDGADVAAILYTIIESCKKVELDPRRYLLKVIYSSARGEDTLTPLEVANQLRQ